jgi:hypothetical protein
MSPILRGWLSHNEEYIHGRNNFKDKCHLLYFIHRHVQNNFVLKENNYLAINERYLALQPTFSQKILFVTFSSEEFCSSTGLSTNDAAATKWV